jgi:hypothetical protein
VREIESTLDELFQPASIAGLSSEATDVVIASATRSAASQNRRAQADRRGAGDGARGLAGDQAETSDIPLAAFV